MLWAGDRASRGTARAAADRASRPAGRPSDRLFERLDELAVVEIGVEALPSQQFVVRALLDDPAVVHDEDRVGVADRREAMGDHEAGPALHELRHRALDQDLS